MRRWGHVQGSDRSSSLASERDIYAEDRDLEQARRILESAEGNDVKGCPGCKEMEDQCRQE